MERMETGKGVDLGLQVTKAVDKYGILNVTAGFFVLFSSMLMVFFVFKVSTMLEFQTETSKQILAYLDEQRYNREQINRRETNPEQIKDLSMLMYSYTLNSTLDEVEVIYRHNHIGDTAITVGKISRVVDNEYQQQAQVFSNFAVKGKDLADFLDPEYNDDLVKMIKTAIYRKGGYRPGQLKASLELQYTKIRNEYQHRVLSYK